MGNREAPTSTPPLTRRFWRPNANTSSNTESATSVKSVDILNKYGDQVVHQYLADNWQLAGALGVLSDVSGESPEEGKPG